MRCQVGYDKVRGCIAAINISAPLHSLTGYGIGRLPDLALHAIYPSRDQTHDFAILLCTSHHLRRQASAPLSDMASILSLSTVVGFLTIRTAAICAVLWAIQLLCRAIYNVSPLHPLYEIPGPKLAAASYLYEFYFDFIQYGRYTHEINRLHEIYGKES